MPCLKNVRSIDTTTKKTSPWDNKGARQRDRSVPISSGSFTCTGTPTLQHSNTPIKVVLMRLRTLVILGGTNTDYALESTLSTGKWITTGSCDDPSPYITRYIAPYFVPLSTGLQIGATSNHTSLPVHHKTQYLLCDPAAHHITSLKQRCRDRRQDRRVALQKRSEAYHFKQEEILNLD